MRVCAHVFTHEFSWQRLKPEPACTTDCRGVALDNRCVEGVRHTCLTHAMASLYADHPSISFFLFLTFFLVVFGCRHCPHVLFSYLTGSASESARAVAVGELSYIHSCRLEQRFVASFATVRTTVKGNNPVRRSHIAGTVAPSAG